MPHDDDCFDCKLESALDRLLGRGDRVIRMLRREAARLSEGAPVRAAELAGECHVVANAVEAVVQVLARHELRKKMAADGELARALEGASAGKNFRAN
jgi:hypothetical protein